MGLTDYTHISEFPDDDAMEMVNISRLKRGPLRYPLQCNVNYIWSFMASVNRLNGKTWGCNCSAENFPKAGHLDLCGVTPEFAAVSKELREFAKDFLGYDTSIWGFSSEIGLKTKWHLSWEDWDEVKDQMKWEERVNDNGNS